MRADRFTWQEGDATYQRPPSRLTDESHMDPRTLPIGHELGDGLRVGFGHVVTAAPVLANSIQQRRATVPATKTKKSAKPKTSPAWKELPDDQLAEHLLKTPTLPDSSWSDRAGRKKRREGESRSDFIRRVLLAAETAS